MPRIAAVKLEDHQKIRVSARTRLCYGGQIDETPGTSRSCRPLEVTARRDLVELMTIACESLEGLGSGMALMAAQVTFSLRTTLVVVGSHYFISP